MSTSTVQWLLTSDGQDHPISGTAVLALNPALRIEVIAHALGQINRFTGHSSRPYSVAEHSLLVADIVRDAGHNCHAQRAALMHDAHEAFCGDVASPIKWSLGSAWLAFENVHSRMVRQHFGLQSAFIGYRSAIKHADLRALATERRDLMRWHPDSNLHWPILDTPGAEVPPVDAVDLNSSTRLTMSWRHHRDAFLDRYRVLDLQCRQAPWQQQGAPA